MTTQQKIEAVLRQIEDLPDEAQTEIVESLIDMRAESLGIYPLDDEERAALARSGDDERLGRFVSEQEIEETFARHSA